MEKGLILLGVLAALGVVMAWSLLMQRTAVRRQQESMDTQREAVERQRAAMDQVDESLKLSRQQVENQAMIISLLEQIRDRTSA